MPERPATRSSPVENVASAAENSRYVAGQSTPEESWKLAEASPYPIFVAGSDGAVLFANAAALEIPNLPRLPVRMGLNNALGNATSLGVSWEDRAFQADCRRNGRDWVCYLRDVTSERNAERKSARLANLSANNPIPVMEIDPFGAVLYANPSAHDRFPEIEQLGWSHPVLNWIQLEFGQVLPDHRERDIWFDSRCYLVSAHWVSRLKVYRVYAVDVTTAKLTAQELEASRIELIRRLVQAAEWRDNDTGAHIARMSAYCRIVAEALGFEAEEAKRLELASTMHDIGKIAIPDSILHKPGKLTEGEREIMETHTIAGGELLRGGSDPLLDMARTIALHHHEKWDGTGYPDGLVGEQIPFIARIVAVCDVFDALSSDRPYKRGWPTKDALHEIRRLSGTHFDPMVVEAFERSVLQILHERNRWQKTAIESEKRRAA